MRLIYYINCIVDARYRRAEVKQDYEVMVEVWWIRKEKVGLPGIEPGTSRLSGARSNRLSYKPTRNALKKEFRFRLSISTINYNYTW